MSGEYDVLTNQPVVIDNVCQKKTATTPAEKLIFTKGSGTIKAGFAGQDHPKCFFPSLCVFAG
jgi:centractin